MSRYKNEVRYVQWYSANQYSIESGETKYTAYTHTQLQAKKKNTNSNSVRMAYNDHMT